MIEEMWRDQKDLEHHLRSEECRNLLLVVELAARRPEITFNTIASSTGIEPIERARIPAYIGEEGDVKGMVQHQDPYNYFFREA